jgi:hypothetical protein
MTTQKDWFKAGGSKDLNSVAVLTGGSISFWNPDFGPNYGIAGKKIFSKILEKVSNASKKKTSAFHGLVINGVDDLPSSGPRFAFRWLTRSNDTRTFIGCLVPAGVVLVEKAPFFVRRSGTETDEAFLLGIMCTRVFDWYVRRLVELSMTFEIVNAVPIPAYGYAEPIEKRIIEISGRLAAVDKRYTEWAKAVEVPVGSVKTPEDREELETELDALVAHLYGLSREHVGHIYKTFHRGWDYKPRLEKVLGYFDQISKAKK